MKKQTQTVTIMKGIFVLLMSILMVGCTKDLQKNTVASKTKSKDAIPAYFFHWETADYMPVPAGGPTIFVPWANGAVRGFSSDILYDYQPTDGWKLLYSAFDPSRTLPSNPYFILYNKYRALLRIYVFVNNGGFQNSDYLISSLNLGPNAIGSNMLNYASQDIVTIGTNVTVASKMEPTQVATGTWYASQYEIAYDGNISTSTYAQIGVNNTLVWQNISSFNLGGTSVGTVKGTITIPGSNGFSLGNLLTGALSAVGLKVFDDNAGTDPAHPGTGNTLSLPASIFEAAKGGISAGLTGAVKNIFSAVFGGGGNTVQTVDLNMSSAITLQGTSSQTGAIFPSSGLGLGVPGTSNSQTAPGFIPYYNEPMGLFYLTSVPHVTTTYTSTQQGTGRTYSNKVIYGVDDASVHMVTNDAVVNISSDGVAISDIKKYVVLIPNSYPGVPSLGYTGAAETVGTMNVYTALGTNKVGAHWIVGTPDGYPLGKTAVRISFTVTPNSNPTQHYLYVKTFYATSDEPPI